jgi:hypothetical protein
MKIKPISDGDIVKRWKTRESAWNVLGDEWVLGSTCMMSDYIPQERKR